MKRKKNGKWKGFLLGMLIYALAVGLCTTVLFKVLWERADEYEKSLPEHRMEAYAASLDNAHIRAVSRDFVASLDAGLRSEEDSYALIAQCFSDGIDWRKDASSSTRDREIYTVLGGSRKLGTVTLERTADGRGADSWTVAEEDYDFSFLLRSDGFILPANWSATCNGLAVGEAYITETGKPYPFLSDLYAMDLHLPTLSVYEIGNYIGDAELHFYDAAGTERSLAPFTDGRDLMPRADEEQSGEIVSFVGRFVPLYVACLANTNQSAVTNYSAIRNLLVPGGEMDNRLRGAIGGQYYAQSRSADITALTVHDIFASSGGYYIADISYTVETYGHHGSVTSDTDMYLILLSDEDGLRVRTAVLH